RARGAAAPCPPPRRGSRPSASSSGRPPAAGRATATSRLARGSRSSSPMGARERSTCRITSVRPVSTRKGTRSTAARERAPDAGSAGDRRGSVRFVLAAVSLSVLLAGAVGAVIDVTIYAQDAIGRSGRSVKLEARLQKQKILSL